MSCAPQSQGDCQATAPAVLLEGPPPAITEPEGAAPAMVLPPGTAPTMAVPQGPAHALAVPQGPAPTLVVPQAPAPTLVVPQAPAPTLVVPQAPAPTLVVPPVVVSEPKSFLAAVLMGSQPASPARGSPRIQAVGGSASRHPRQTAGPGSGRHKVCFTSTLKSKLSALLCSLLESLHSGRAHLLICICKGAVWGVRTQGGECRGLHPLIACTPNSTALLWQYCSCLCPITQNHSHSLPNIMNSGTHVRHAITMPHLCMISRHHAPEASQRHARLSSLVVARSDTP